MTSLQKLVRRLDILEEGLQAVATQPRLPRSSIDGGALELKDIHGNTAGFVGTQFDGSVTTTAVGGTPPPSPSTPLVEPVLGGLKIYWDGTWVDGSVTRSDWRRTTFHAVTDVDDLDPTNPAQTVGEINVATGGEITASLPPVEHFIFAVAWSDAGKFSVESDVAFGTPGKIEDEPAFSDALEEIEQVKGTVVNVPLTYRQPVAPTMNELAGRKAVWYDTSSDDGEVAWFYNGSTWAQVVFGAGALAAEAVIAETIAAGALDGKTITGPLIQTMADAGLGIKLINNTLLAFDGAGDVVFLLDGDDGSIALAGALFTGGDITGANITGATLTGVTVTGGTLRTASSGERLEINTNEVDASMIRFWSGIPEETAPAFVGSDSIRVDANNVARGLAMAVPAISGVSGSAGMGIRAGRGAVPGLYPEPNIAEVYSSKGTAASARTVAVAGSAGLVATDSATENLAKLTGPAVQIESVSTPARIGTFSNTSILAPVGEVVEYVGLGAAPSGWAYMEGQELQISAYTELYNLLTTNGTVFRFGANTNGLGGVGSSHFRLPNAKGRTIVHLDTTQTEFDVMGEAGGSKAVTLTAAQSGLPEHYHSLKLSVGGALDQNDGGVRGSQSPDTNFRTGGVRDGSGAYGSGAAGAKPAAEAHTNLQPYLVLRYMIRLRA